jgi:hypothetical protein
MLHSITFFITFSALVFWINLVTVQADSEAPNLPNIQISRQGGYYSKSIPAEFTGTKGRTRIFRVEKKRDVLIQKYAWYAPRLYLEPAEDGIYVVRPGQWPRGLEASSGDMAIEFYKNDLLLKNYSTLELAGDPGNVHTTFSHYEVIKEYLGFRREEGLTTFGITLVDGRSLDFNADTGEMIMPLVDRTDEQKVSIGSNALFGFKVINETAHSLDIEIEYNYDPQEEDWANLSAGLWHKGLRLPFTGFVPARLVPGKNTARIAMSLSGQAPECFVSDKIEVTMYRKKGYEFLPNLTTRLFLYEKFWARGPEATNLTEKGPEPGASPGYGRIGEVRVVRETNDLLELEVHYVYDPQQSRFAELSAGTYLEEGSPNHDKQIPVLLKPGFNATLLKIERSPMAPVQYETNRIGIVMAGNFLSDQLNDRMLVSETFVYPKTWSQSFMAGLSTAPIGQPLPREGKGSSDMKRNCLEDANRFAFPSD